MAIFLKQSTSIDVRLGPFVDVGDGFTPETGVTIAASDEAEILKANGAATVAMTGTLAAVSNCDGWYDYTIQTGDVDTVGELVIVMQDDDVYLPVHQRFYVVEEAVYDAMYGASAAGPLQSTTAGRTLDVNATGEAGLDLDNTSGTIAAAQLATDCITAAKIAADAITSSELADSAVTKITDDIMAETLTEPSQAIPPTTGVADVADALRYLYFALTNRVDVDDTAGAKEFYNRAESAVQWKKAVSDSGSVYTEDTGAAGP